jgi:DNA-binding NarL/FixJ family response regulator
MTDRMVAEQLGITEGTVTAQLRAVYARLELTRSAKNPRVLVTLYAIRAGLVRVTA